MARRSPSRAGLAVARSGAVALTLVLLVACRKKASPDPSASSGAAASGPAGTASARGELPTVHVDPALLASGRVVVAPAERRSASDEVPVPGEVMAGEQGEAQVTALSPGRVADLAVALGGAVRKGQVLATIDVPEVGRAQAEALRAESRALLASRALARQLDLERQEATSRAAVDQARAEDSAARADVLAARTMLQALGAGAADPDAGGRPSSRVALRAPLDGIVVERRAVLGGPVTAGEALFRIVAPERRIVLAKVQETLAVRTAPGTPARIVPRQASGAAPSSCPAQVEASLQIVDENRAIPVRVRLLDACPELAVGRYVDVFLPGQGGTDAGGLTVVPEGALVEVRGASLVFVQGKDRGTFEARPVRKGLRIGSAVVVDEGLLPGEPVAVGGTLLLKGELLREELQP